MNARLRIIDGCAVALGIAVIALPAFQWMLPAQRWGHLLAGMVVAAFAGYALARTRRGLPRGPTPTAAAALGAVMIAGGGNLALAALVLAVGVAGIVEAGRTSKGGLLRGRKTTAEARSARRGTTKNGGS